MKTPIVTIGVRGSDYAIRVLQSHGRDDSVALNHGDAAHVSGDADSPQAIDAGKGVFGSVGDEESSWWMGLTGMVIITAAA